MTIHDILERLERVRKMGNGWTACCPAHEDKRPSLSIAYRDGKILLYCHVGCRYQDILIALGVSSLRETAGVGTARGYRDVATTTTQRPQQPPAARGRGCTPIPSAPEPPIDWVSICADIQEGLVGTEVGTLHLQLDVSETSLARLECGWSDKHNAYSFPMRDGLGTIVGVSLRGKTGTKWAIPGSKLGLFIPYNLTTEGPIFMPEGASDTAALLDLGLNAVGRPQAMIRGERLEQVRELMNTPLCKGRPLVVVADNDSHDIGWQGAHQLALAMRRHVSNVKVIEPHGCKDVREWIRNGVRAGTLLTILANTGVV